MLYTGPARTGFVRAILKFRWLLLYTATVTTMIWWYEFRPARIASQRIQGTWRQIEGLIPNERLGDAYRHVDENEAWLAYPFCGEWNVQRSRITIRPADGFFVVRRAFGFDYGNTRETEYVVFLKNDELYILRGLARFDSVMENTVEKLRRIDALPTDARQSIHQYLDEIQTESKSSDKQRSAAHN